MISNKTIARIVGAFFLIAIAAYGIGNGLIESLLAETDYLTKVSENIVRVRVGAILMLINSAVVVGIGVLMFPILKQHNEQIALGYVGARVIESAILIVGITSLLSLTTLSQEYSKAGIAHAPYFKTLGALGIQGNYSAYQIAMLVLGLGSLMFCYLLFKANLVPRFLSVWGFVGYALLLTGALLDIFGRNLGLILSIPGGLFEIALAVWLIVKGFSPAALLSESAKLGVVEKNT